MALPPGGPLSERVMYCRQAQVLSIPYITGDLHPASDQRRRLEGHLAVCSTCAAKYAAYRETISFIEEHKAEFAAALAILEAEQAARRQDGGAGLSALTEVESMPAAGGRVRVHQVLRPAFAVAACLVLGALCWLAGQPRGPGSESHRHRNARVVAEGVSPMAARDDGLLIEEVLADRGVGRAHVKVGGVLQTQTGEVKTFLVGRKHRLILNGETRLSIEPLSGVARVGYLVRLEAGELGAAVLHDGAPFMVQTTHGRAVITGTRFDIKVREDETTLVVADGTVAFGPHGEEVQVGSGQKSVLTVTGVTAPAPCDVAGALAWMDQSTAGWLSAPRDEDAATPGPVPQLVSAGQVNLETLDYAAWIEEKRAWFRREFPDVFRLKDALSEEGIDVDYATLLLQSQIVWKFAYPPGHPHRLLPADAEGLTRLARDYGRDVAWLQEHGLVGPPPAPARHGGNEEAFVRWQRVFADALAAESEVTGDALLESLQACVYIVNTRSLLWFAVASAPGSYSDEVQRQLRTRLQQQVDIAAAGMRHILQLHGLGGDQAWASCSQRQWTQALLWIITEMATVETELAPGRNRLP